MAEQFLDGAKVGPVAEQVGGVSMPKTVGMDRGVAGEDGGVQFHNAPRASGSEAPARVVKKQRWIPGPARLAESEIAVQGLGRFRPERNLPFFAAFATNANPTLGEIEIVQV